jgi:hypothetical protein
VHAVGIPQRSKVLTLLPSSFSEYWEFRSRFPLDMAGGEKGDQGHGLEDHGERCYLRVETCFIPSGNS